MCLGIAITIVRDIVRVIVSFTFFYNQIGQKKCIAYNNSNKISRGAVTTHHSNTDNSQEVAVSSHFNILSLTKVFKKIIKSDKY